MSDKHKRLDRVDAVLNPAPARTLPKIEIVIVAPPEYDENFAIIRPRRVTEVLRYDENGKLYQADVDLRDYSPDVKR